MELPTLFETPINNQHGISIQKSVHLYMYIANVHATGCQPQVGTSCIPTVNSGTVDALTSEVEATLVPLNFPKYEVNLNKSAP